MDFRTFRVEEGAGQAAKEKGENRECGVMDTTVSISGGRAGSMVSTDPES